MGHVWPWQGGTSTQGECEALEKKDGGGTVPEGSQGGLSGVSVPWTVGPWTVHGAECPEPSRGAMGSRGCVCMCRAPTYHH